MAFLLILLPVNPTRSVQKSGNKILFFSWRQILNQRAKSSPFCQRHTLTEAEIKCEIEKEIKIQSYALVQLEGTELNKLSVGGRLWASALKIRRKMAVKQHAPGLDSRMYSNFKKVIFYIWKQSNDKWELTSKSIKGS